MKYLGWPVLLAASLFSGLPLAQAIQVTYCSGTHMTGHCWIVNPFGNVCMDVIPELNDKVVSAQIDANANCVFWKEYNCQGDHTIQLDGGIADFGAICGGWSKKISSFKCCPGTAATNWLQSERCLSLAHPRQIRQYRLRQRLAAEILERTETGESSAGPRLLGSTHIPPPFDFEITIDRGLQFTRATE
ncbi:hypothetical protein L218DRAFT_948525 [Marasmius fiardii PR-910]|nr:hypothetical protein L218DRAFT_948525 [Marasmius fiardii PR-910]